MVLRGTARAFPDLEGEILAFLRDAAGDETEASQAARSEP